MSFLPFDAGRYSELFLPKSKDKVNPCVCGTVASLRSLTNKLDISQFRALGNLVMEASICVIGSGHSATEPPTKTKDTVEDTANDIHPHPRPPSGQGHGV